MARSIWRGAISFGLVNVPVKLYSAVSKKTVRFNQLHDADHARIQQKRVCSEDGEEVPYENIVKGFEIAPDRYVVITPDELDALDPAKTRSIDIEDFVDLADIDPLYYEHPYYLVPDTGAAKAYRLLLEALRETNKVAIARVVLRTKEYLVAIRPAGDVLTMETMLFADELIAADGLDELPDADVKATERELAMARQLIEAQATEFDPSKYRDEYRERVLELIERKAAGEEIVGSAAGRGEPGGSRPDGGPGAEPGSGAGWPTQGAGQDGLERRRDGEEVFAKAGARPPRRSPRRRSREPRSRFVASDSARFNASAFCTANALPVVVEVGEHLDAASASRRSAGPFLELGRRVVPVAARVRRSGIARRSSRRSARDVWNGRCGVSPITSAAAWRRSSS